MAKIKYKWTVKRGDKIVKVSNLSEDSRESVENFFDSFSRYESVRYDFDNRIVYLEPKNTFFIGK